MGQTVLVSGSTVLIAMAGMFVAGNSLFKTIGLGTMIVVLAAMIGSLTVPLPAVLHRLGDNVDRGRIPVFRGQPRDDGAWGRFVALVLRRPVASALLSGGLLFALALPAAGMHTKLPNLTDLPHDLKMVPRRADPARIPQVRRRLPWSSSGRRVSTPRRCSARTPSFANAPWRQASCSRRSRSR